MLPRTLVSIKSLQPFKKVGQSLYQEAQSLIIENATGLERATDLLHTIGDESKKLDRTASALAVPFSKAITRISRAREDSVTGMRDANQILIRKINQFNRENERAARNLHKLP